MSVQLIKHEIGKFLARKEAEVLCIRGNWGVGKTYTWGKALEIAQASNAINLPRYSYVSLFGVNSLEELKLAIFENVITLSEGLRTADLETLDAFISKHGSWRKLLKVAPSLPFVRGFIGADITSIVSFMTIRDQIICIDDLERRGEKLSVNDVLGLISYLREQRRCKVVLILNDEKLDTSGKEVFERNLEKVVDVALVYAPTANDSLKIAITDDGPCSKLISDRCISLNITNIRVIKRIVRLVDSIKPLITEFDDEILTTAITSIVLFSWSNDQPEDAPSLAYLKSLTQDTYGLGRYGQLSTEESAWNAIIDAYGYTWTDALDLALMDGVSAGTFDPEEVTKAAQIINEKVLATKADGSFETAWELYHDTFDNNQDDVLDCIFDSFMKNAKYINTTNLNGTVSLFKDLGRPDQAQKILHHYIASHDEGRQFFDLDENIFADMINDPDVRAAFKEKATQVMETRDIPAIMLSIKDRMDGKDLLALATAPVEEYRKAFKSHSGRELRRMIAGVLQFERIINATDEMKEVTSRARQALTLIGEESSLNARRVARLGIKIGPSKSQSD